MQFGLSHHGDVTLEHQDSFLNLGYHNIGYIPAFFWLHRRQVGNTELLSMEEFPLDLAYRLPAEDNERIERICKAARYVPASKEVFSDLLTSINIRTGAQHKPYKFTLNEQNLEWWLDGSEQSPAATFTPHESGEAIQAYRKFLREEPALEAPRLQIACLMDALGR